LLFNKNVKRLTLFFAISIIAVIVSLLPLPGLSSAGSKVLGIFVFAMLSWLTEVIPLSVTAMIVVFLSALLLPSEISGLKASYFYSSLSSSTVILFAGGYFLASGMQKHKIDMIFSKFVLSKTGNNPKMVLLGLILTTAFLSMWMSNTATTALMIAVSLPIVRTISKDDPFSTALVLGIPFAANVGGIATPVGTPPNAIAIQMLLDNGYKVTFSRWMMWGFPIAVILVIFLWWLLLIIYKPKTKEVILKIESVRIGWRQKYVLVIFVVTALLWLLSSVIHLSSSLIAFIPPVAFLSTGILNKEDFRTIGWDILILVGGGICLGMAMTESGLSGWILHSLHLSNIHPLLLLLILGLLTYFASNFMSNTAAANIFIPLAIGLGKGFAPIVVFIAITASCSMLLPVSTPPNAIAYGSGAVETKQMARTGLFMGIAGMTIAFIIVILFKF